MEVRCPECGKTVPHVGEGHYCPYCAASLATVEGDETIQAEEVISYNSPWDDRENLGFVRAFIDTLMQVLFNPVKFYSGMQREGGLGGPLLYGFIVCEIGLLFALMWQGMSVFMPSFMDRGGFGYMGTQMAGMTFLFFISPALVVAGLFIASGILHVCLLIVGGANRGFETTFRVVCYASSAQLWGIVPFCGGFVGGIWNLVLQVIGLREAHETTTGRAVLAVFLPAILCCGLTFFGIMVFMSSFRGGY
ncbi:MAG: YIP1 family protein [Gemmatimonadota bacterium]|nr:MAG: YIP1 family protein [Gemmatimonadota bacterium]